MITLSNIAKSARSVKTPKNKGMAFRAVKTIACTLTDEQREELHGELARLYAMFEPALPKKPASYFEWCAKAAGWKDIREHLRYVHVTEERMVGTDGHRVHMAPNSENLEPGFYDKSGVKIHDLKHAHYPDIERVMVPDLRGNGRNIFESKVDDLPTGNLTDDSNKIHHYYRFNDQVCINRDYVNQAVSMEDPDALLEWSIGVGNQVVAIELSGNRRVAIMPVRVYKP